MSLFKFDQVSEPVASHVAFAGRMFVNIIAAAMIIGLALGGGMYGYHTLEGLSWLDSFLNAAMLLGGMGPVDAMHPDAGKIFAGAYALASGLLFVLVAGVVLAPVLHRVLHALHVDCDDEK
jgi:hypothetical protein